MKSVLFIKELREQLAKFDDNDVVVIEIHDALVGEDLYQFSVDSIEHHDEDASVEFREVRLCLIPNN